MRQAPPGGQQKSGNLRNSRTAGKARCSTKPAHSWGVTVGSPGQGLLTTAVVGGSNPVRVGQIMPSLKKCVNVDFDVHSHVFEATE